MTWQYKTGAVASENALDMPQVTEGKECFFGSPPTSANALIRMPNHMRGFARPDLANGEAHATEA